MSSVSFSIEPTFLVNHFRQMILEEFDFNHVVDLMTKDIQGLTKEVAISILCCNHSIGDDFKLIEEDKNSENVISFFNNSKFMYRNYITYNDLIYKPYSLVTDLGYIDLFVSETHKELTQSFIDCDDDSEQILHVVKKTITDIIESKEQQIMDNSLRALHYARRENTIAIPVEYEDSTMYFLCENKTKTIPPFIKLSTSDEVVSNFLNGLGNDTTGYSHCYVWFDDLKKSKNEYYWGNCVLENGDIIEYPEYTRRLKLANYGQKIKKDILKQNDVHGFIELTNDEEEVVATVPKLPFLHWVFRGTTYIKNLPPYKAVSMTGLKMSMDNPIHSDWMLAAGLDLDLDYEISSDVYKAAAIKLHELQESIFDYDHAVLSSGDNLPIKGKAIVCTKDNLDNVQPGNIVIIPDCSNNYEAHVRKSIKNGRGGVISAIGSRAMHMAVVARELDIIILNDPLSLEKYTTGMDILIEPDKGSITVV